MDAASRPAEGRQRQQWLGASALPSALVHAHHLTPGAGPCRQQAAPVDKLQLAWGIAGQLRKQ